MSLQFEFNCIWYRMLMVKAKNTCSRLWLRNWISSMWCRRMKHKKGNWRNWAVHLVYSFTTLEQEHTSCNRQYNMFVKEWVASSLNYYWSLVECYLQIRQTLHTLETHDRVETHLAELRLPLEKVAEIAWKFVAEPNPVIVTVLERYSGNDTIQERYHGKWNVDSDNYTLVYARPLVYRSFHGMVMKPALVGRQAKM